MKSKSGVQQLKDAGKKVLLIDIRTTQEYEKQHVPEAMNIPWELLADNLSQFSLEDTLVCICNHGKERSQQAAAFLYSAGFKNTYYLEGGTAAWIAGQ